MMAWSSSWRQFGPPPRHHVTASRVYMLTELLPASSPVLVTLNDTESAATRARFYRRRIITPLPNPAPTRTSRRLVLTRSEEVASLGVLVHVNVSSGKTLFENPQG